VHGGLPSKVQEVSSWQPLLGWLWTRILLRLCCWWMHRYLSLRNIWWLGYYVMQKVWLFVRDSVLSKLEDSFMLKNDWNQHIRSKARGYIHLCQNQSTIRCWPMLGHSWLLYLWWTTAFSVHNLVKQYSHVGSSYCRFRHLWLSWILVYGKELYNVKLYVCQHHKWSTLPLSCWPWD